MGIQTRKPTGASPHFSSIRSSKSRRSGASGPCASQSVGKHFHRLRAGHAVSAVENEEGNTVRAEFVGLMVVGDDGVLVAVAVQQLFDTMQSSLAAKSGQ